MKLTAVILGLLGSVIALMFSFILLIGNISGFDYWSHYYNIVTLGYFLATVLGLVNLTGIILAKVKSRRIYLIVASIILFLCGAGYIFLYWPAWPFGLGRALGLDKGTVQVIIVLFCVPLMYIAAILFSITARKYPK
jgi:hypothetical protein